MKKLLLALCLVCLSVALRAGVAPSPEMDFTFVYNTPDKPAIHASFSEQIQCKDSLCTESSPLGVYGLQKLYCNAETCFSIAYEYDRFQKLIVMFDDGVLRESNIFKAPGTLRAAFTVYVNPHSLNVQEAPTPSTVNVVLRRDAWTSLFIILLLEAIAAFAYLRYTNKKYSIIYYVVIANLASMPISWTILSRYTNETALLWIFCFVFEALFIWAFNRRKIKLHDSFMLSLAINVTSYSVGMMLGFLIAPLMF